MNKIFGDSQTWLKQVGAARGGIIVLGGVLYILGYAVWSVHAYQEHLGLLPALEAQYLIAGIVPFLIGAGIYFFCRGSWIRKLHLPGWLNILERRTWLRNFLVAAIFASAVLDRFGLLEYFGSFGKYLAIRNKWVFIGVVSLVVLLSLPTINPTRDLRLSTGERRVNISALVVVLVWLLGIYAMYSYVTLLYSNLPQSLGGVQPRCAYLDLQKSGLSKETLTAILRPDPSSQTESNSHLPIASNSGESQIVTNDITRSDQIYVLFSGSDYFLIRAKDQIYEIKKEVVRAVQPCNDKAQNVGTK